MRWEMSCPRLTRYAGLGRPESPVGGTSFGASVLRHQMTRAKALIIEPLGRASSGSEDQLSWST
jgi:hypothetical protein